MEVILIRKKLKKKCEKCNENIGEEIHHLQHQVNANNSNSYIKTFHKDPCCKFN